MTGHMRLFLKAMSMVSGGIFWVWFKRTSEGGIENMDPFSLLIVLIAAAAALTQGGNDGSHLSNQGKCANISNIIAFFFFKSLLIDHNMLFVLMVSLVRKQIRIAQFLKKILSQ